MSTVKKFETASLAELKQVRGVCLDIDDTLSTAGKLTAQAYDALWRLRDAGFRVVPITGRPAGWCDHFARFWPIDAIVGENGAFTFFMKEGVRKRLDTLPRSASYESQMKKLRDSILARFPHARWASDQSYREYDLAIDICEDVPTWPAPDVEELLKICKGLGAHAKLSSIHVNAWFGDYDKRSGFEHWLSSGAPGCPSPVPEIREWLFIGDSPNDEPMFAAFEHTVGVANLTRYLDRLKNPPRWLTEGASGAGFAEMANALISSLGSQKSL